MKHPLAAVPFAVFAAALAAQPPAPLTLDDCLALAAGGHPALAAARAGVSSAGEAVGEARAPFYPQLDLGAGYHRWQRHAFLPASLAAIAPGGVLPDVIGPLDDWNGGVTSSVTLLDFGARRAGLDGAKARFAGAEADASAAQADVRLTVQSAFYALAAAQDLKAVAEKNLGRTEAHQRLAVARREAGAAPQADVLRMDAELADARLQLIDADSRVRIANGRLNTAIGRPADTPLAILPPDTAVPPPAQAEIDAAAERALERRPEIKSDEKRAEAARSAVAAAQAARAPKVSADAAFGWHDTTFVPETREWQAGVSVDFPVFDAGSRAHQVARLKAELARAQAEFESRRLQVRDEVWAAAVELGHAWAAIAANQASVQASEESLRVVRERYQDGAAVVTDLLDTQTALVRAESSLAEARWNYLAARATFDRATGEDR